MINGKEKNNLIIKQVMLSDSSCTSCASVIEYHYNKLDGIEASVNFAVKKIKFTYEAQKWNETKISKVMKKLGYEISGFQNLGKSEHEHTSVDHDHHLQKHHGHLLHFHYKNLRAIIELIVGWLLLLPLLLTMVKSLSFSWFNNHFFQFGMATIIQLYFGRKFYSGIYRELIKQKWPGMNTLIVFASLTAYIYSIYKMLQQSDNDHLYFEAGASIIMIVLLGDLISAFVQDKATNGLTALTNLQSRNVLLINDQNLDGKLVKIEDIKINDRILVRKGEAIPTDGILVSAKATVNEALISGESKLINKKQGATLIGGTINNGETLQMQATKIGKDTVLANIIQAVEHAQSQKPKIQKIADKIAGIFIPTIILLALLVFIIRYFLLHNELGAAMEIAVATLIIACPCAFGIATPLAVAIGVNKAAQFGIIYNEISVFEKITAINAICFDKTGTLTTGELAINAIYGDKKYLAVAVTLEKYSTHPIAKAFDKYQNEHEITPTTVVNIKEEIGKGMKGKWNNQKVMLTNLDYLINNKLVFDQTLIKVGMGKLREHNILIALAVGDKIVNIYGLGDSIRPQARKIIKRLQKQVGPIYLISGDQAQEVAVVAKKLHIQHYYSQVKPIMKAEIIKKLQAQGKKVAFIGDGINDSVALQQADLAIAMGQGSDIAKKYGAITLVNDNINAIYQAIKLTKITKKFIWLNFLWAFSYNLIIIPLAAAGSFKPSIAALAMVLSDITVIVNSLIFKYWKINYKT